MSAYHFSSSVVCVVNLHNEGKLSLTGLSIWTVFVHDNTVCSCVCAQWYLQDILYLADNVLSVWALSLQGDAVSDPLLVQSGQLCLCHRQAHAALLPARTNAVQQLKTFYGHQGNMTEHKAES